MGVKKHITLYIILIMILLVSFWCFNKYFVKNQDSSDVRDFSSIIESKELKVIIAPNFIDYFIYDGMPMGLYLQILEDFADKYNLRLKITTESNFEKAIDLIKNGDCDIFASNLVPSKWLKENYSLTIPIRKTKQVLIQRKPDNIDSLYVNKLEDFLQKNILKKIYVRETYKNFISVKNIFMLELDTIPIEIMAKNVSNGTYNYAICDYNLAKVLQHYYTNLNIDVEISDWEEISWILNRKSTVLSDSLNVWLESFKNSEKYDFLEKKYIENNRRLVNINSEYYSGNKGRISVYDELIKEYSKKINWDWRLLTSLIYQESRFNINAESWAGAYGLMQLMPQIYKKFSIDSTWTVNSQIYAGVKYIEYLNSLIPKDITDSITQIKMILAGYNIGFGHVEDAIRLTKKNNFDINSWNDISYFLINLSDPTYYNDSVVKLGYFPGIYSVDFSNSVYDRYLHYRNVISH